ncbi:protein phosphatase 2C domain-containing protein [Desulfohalobiaceae bacterium Ax17]|uniref:protein phosphatase 2C domain-containing protein n=1 Tax=Desulfovulcanus ferrireducens TaxID=2831190 RepID=UPI00207BA049|nr:protein phosphatase 2C domain-containing protein [Desulfovulcanus ferrireducens]MBT8764290.1 protein phosphatase 2C domain-containing protein [Desulfovulcanus ferrireducens]
MIVEYLLEKGTGSINEDSLLVGHNIFGVFDGATSLCGTTWEDGKTGGFFASSIACKTFSQNNDSLLALAEQANKKIREAMLEKEVDITKKEYLWSTSMAVVRIVDNRIDWVQTGDNLVLIIKKDHSWELLTEVYDHDRETLTMWQNMADSCSGDILTELNDQIKKVRKEMNISYGVLNGEKEALNFINTGSAPIDDIRHILLFTDGLFIPHADPQTPRSFDEFSRLFLKSGLKGIREHVRSLEETDPRCCRYPRFKLHDDIAAVAISLS